MKLASDLKKSGLTTSDVRVNYFKDRHKEILHLFDEQNGDPYLKDVQGLFEWLGYLYNAAVINQMPN